MHSYYRTCSKIMQKIIYTCLSAQMPVYFDRQAKSVKSLTMSMKSGVQILYKTFDKIKWPEFAGIEDTGPPLPTRHELEMAAKLARKHCNPKGFLVLLGDKHILWSEKHDAFIMFSKTPRYWVALGDPVGNEPSFAALLRQFSAIAKKKGAKIVFYQARDAMRPLYNSRRLTLLKIGEEAKVYLPDFKMSGRKRADLRNSRNRFQKTGYRFEILEGADVRENLPRLKEISEQWLNNKSRHEKGFSLGAFDERYIFHSRIAVARNEDGKIMAFANYWETEGKEEIAIDLMRYDTACNGPIMDYLFTEFMLWAQGQGVKWFSLGMAPLSRLEYSPRAPFWHKVGTAIFILGEEFYNFEGLYEYKEKFDPRWEPRYIAIPAGSSGTLIMMTVARLISGGWKGLFTR